MKRITSILCFLAVGTLAIGQQPTRSVSVEDAKTLVLAALPSKTKQLPKFEVEGGDDPLYPHFYVFQALWAGAPNGSVVVGHYAEDKTTADVWNAVMACDELTTPAVRRLQAKVRSRIGLSPLNTRYDSEKNSLPVREPGWKLQQNISLESHTSSRLKILRTNSRKNLIPKDQEERGTPR